MVFQLCSSSLLLVFSFGVLRFLVIHWHSSGLAGQPFYTCIPMDWSLVR